MSAYLVWFVLAAVLAGLELLSGTFYLLLYGLACAMGGLLAWAGAGEAWQYGLSAVFAVAGTIWLRRRKFLKPAETSESLDIGQRVSVESWTGENTARVRYRGTGWDAELAAPLSAGNSTDTVALLVGTASLADRPSVLFIVGQRGNTLLVVDHLEPKPVDSGPVQPH
ncbi:NfeD family protein [Chitinimonas sp.]|uniref:NfeD family protein n=1 Tax=Chitinimonas sp. TaxID=1934313 RepID=UPI0035B1F7FD